MKALLPLAGQGTRMAPLGLTTPKSLLPILNKPLLKWTLEALLQNGVSEFVLVINAGEFGEKIKAYVESVQTETQFAQAQFQFATQEDQQGTAHVVQTAKEFFSETEEFIFLNGDDLYGPKNIAQLLSTNGVVVSGHTVKDPEKYGVLQIDDQHHLLQIVEKPNTTAGLGNLSNINCMKLSGRVFSLFDQLAKSPRGEYELTDLVNLLVKEAPIQIVETVDYWFPIGYPWQILEATEFLAPKVEQKIEGTVEENVVIKGKVVLPKSSIIKAGSYIEGNLIVGENSVIGPNAYIRDNVVVGSDCKIGFGVEVKNSVFGNNTHVPHLSYIGDSILGEGVNFAGGSITANFRHDMGTVKTPIKGQMTDTGRLKFGTVIGDHALLGIGTVIYPGRKIWPKMTTLPGQIVDKDIVE